MAAAQAMEELDVELVARLRAGDEAAFLALVDRHHGAMVRMATRFVGSEAVAEEVAQEAWMGVLAGLGGFEGRSSLRSWIFTIVANAAKKRGGREARSVPLSSMADPEAEGGEAAVDSQRFRDASDRWAGHWHAHAVPEAWPEERVLARQTIEHVRRAIAALPDAQRDVITLRDVEGWSADEVCEALAVTEANQRVLLHRARSKVRAHLEQVLR